MDKRQILLIDDALNYCDTFLKALDNIPAMFRCSFARNSSDAIRQIKKITPDYIFVDISAPDHYGLRCVEDLKKVRKFRHIPVYLYSATFDKCMFQKAADLGALTCVKRATDARTLTKLFKTLFYNSMRAEVRNFAPRKNE